MGYFEIEIEKNKCIMFLSINCIWPLKKFTAGLRLLEGTRRDAEDSRAQSVSVLDVSRSHSRRRTRCANN